MLLEVGTTCGWEMFHGFKYLNSTPGFTADPLTLSKSFAFLFLLSWFAFQVRDPLGMAVSHTVC